MNNQIITAIELDDASLDCIDAGIKWSTTKFFRFVGTVVASVAGGAAGCAIGAAVAIGTAATTCIVHTAQDIHSGKSRSTKDALRDYADLLPFSI